MRQLLDDRRQAFLLVGLVVLVHLAVAWPGAADRGVIAEEIQPYLAHYPKLLDDAAGRVAYLPPNDDPALRAAVDAGRDVAPRWVGTPGWPEVAYQAPARIWPLFVRAHQTAIGTYFGVALQPLLGGGVAGVRRSSVLLGLALILLVWGLGRRLQLSPRWSTVAALGCASSPGLWFFGRTGYGFELASRVVLLLALFVAAPRRPLGRGRAVALGLLFALAVLCRATIAATLAPPLLLLLFHPRRFAGPWRTGGVLALGGGVPIALAVLAAVLLPFAAHATPGANLPLAMLSSRTLTMPAIALTQLAWMVDARVVLLPLVDGQLTAGAVWLRALAAGVVLATALWRWWHGRAGEAERLFAGALLGNSLVSAWLYGDPKQFQLGMALEPLFVLALCQQLAVLRPTRIAVTVAAVLLGLRAFTLASLWLHERRTDNPMLSGAAQRQLVAVLEHDGVRGDRLITTTYDHVGLLESATHERLRPVHAWRLLRTHGDGAGDDDALTAQWQRVLQAVLTADHVLLTRAPNLYAGPFTDNDTVARTLERALATRGRTIDRRVPIAGDGGGAVFELLTLSPDLAGAPDAPR